jgi:glycosyltransferase involved in cell wall biosynthesis
MSKAKGVDVLVQAFSDAAAPNARLELIGPPQSNDGFYRDLLSRAGASDRIRLRGAVPADQVPAVLAALDVLCIPSQWPETFSLIMYEAFAAGTPVFVSDLGNPADVVAKAGCGRVLPASDVSAWGEAIRNVAANPHTLEGWRSKLPLPTRSEEETFLYELLYRAAQATKAEGNANLRHAPSATASADSRR